MFSRGRRNIGPVHILVNGAGVNIKTRMMSEMTPEQWDQVIAINATGAYNCMHAVLPQMRERRDGLDDQHFVNQRQARMEAGGRGVFAPRNLR